MCIVYSLDSSTVPIMIVLDTIYRKQGNGCLSGDGSVQPENLTSDDSFLYSVVQCAVQFTIQFTVKCAVYIVVISKVWYGGHL